MSPTGVIQPVRLAVLAGTYVRGVCCRWRWRGTSCLQPAAPGVSGASQLARRARWPLRAGGPSAPALPLLSRWSGRYGPRVAPLHRAAAAPDDRRRGLRRMRARGAPGTRGRRPRASTSSPHGTSRRRSSRSGQERPTVRQRRTLAGVPGAFRSTPTAHGATRGTASSSPTGSSSSPQSSSSRTGARPGQPRAACCSTTSASESRRGARTGRL